MLMLITSVGNAQSFDFSCEIDNTELVELTKEFFAEENYKGDPYYYYGVVLNFYEGGNSGIAGEAQACYNPDANWIIININKYYWDRFSVLQRKFLMYHELGHDVLNYGHLQTTGEIMTEGGFSWPSDYPVSSLAVFNAAKDRMFAGTDQVPQDCTTSKGGMIKDGF